jgi:hypothetical protein
MNKKKYFSFILIVAMILGLAPPVWPKRGNNNNRSASRSVDTTETSSSAVTLQLITNNAHGAVSSLRARFLYVTSNSKLSLFSR